MSLGRLIEMENATAEDMEYGQRNVYGIPSWISKREWMERYRSGPVVVVQEGQSQTQPIRNRIGNACKFAPRPLPPENRQPGVIL